LEEWEETLVGSWICVIEPKFHLVSVVVGIHEVHRENKWMGSSDLDGLNKTTSRTAGRGLNEKQYDNKEVKLINMAKQVNTS